MGLILIAGMRRSGSTVAFQMAYQLVEGRKYSLGFTETPTQIYDGPLFAAKTHSYLKQLEEGVRDGHVRVVTTYRDPRDIVVSIMDLRRETFAKVLESGQIQHAMYEQSRWEKLEGCYHAKYEDFYQDLGSLAKLVGLAAGIEVTDEHAQSLADKLSLERNMVRAAKIDNIRPDMLFPGHIQDGSVGQWKRRLSDDQLETIYALAGKWMHEHGYGVEGFTGK